MHQKGCHVAYRSRYSYRRHLVHTALHYMCKRDVVAYSQSKSNGKEKRRFRNGKKSTTQKKAKDVSLQNVRMALLACYCSPVAPPFVIHGTRAASAFVIGTVAHISCAPLLLTAQSRCNVTLLALPSVMAMALLFRIVMCPLTLLCMQLALPLMLPVA